MCLSLLVSSVFFFFHQKKKLLCAECGETEQKQVVEFKKMIRGFVQQHHATYFFPGQQDFACTETEV